MSKKPYDPPIATVTAVVYRKWKDEGDIIALFPALPGGQYGLCSCYQHVGQHGDADYQNVISQTVTATPEEYADLEQELLKTGYVLKTYQRETLAMHRARIDGYMELYRDSG